MSMSTKWNNFRHRQRSWGLQRALHWEVMNFVAKLGVHVHYVIVETNLREIHGEERPLVPPGIDTRFVGTDELLPYIDRVPDLDRGFLDSVFARGDVCIANFHGDELVGFAFISFTRARASAQLDVLVPDGFQYVYKGWTHPDYRRSNLTAARIYLRHQLLRQNHSLRGISYVETHNYASLLHRYRHPRERSLSMGLCGWFTLFGRQIPWNSRTAKWIGFELVRKEDLGRRQYV
jgi:hypothetical protein